MTLAISLHHERIINKICINPRECPASRKLIVSVMSTYAVLLVSISNRIKHDSDILFAIVNPILPGGSAIRLTLPSGCACVT